MIAPANGCTYPPEHQFARVPGMPNEGTGRPFCPHEREASHPQFFALHAVASPKPIKAGDMQIKPTEATTRAVGEAPLQSKQRSTQAIIAETLTSVTRHRSRFLLKDESVQRYLPKTCSWPPARGRSDHQYLDCLRDERA